MITESQKELIKKWLLSGRSLTPLDALKEFGCFRLSARIENLRSEGLAISTEMVERNNKRVALYRLEK